VIGVTERISLPSVLPNPSGVAKVDDFLYMTNAQQSDHSERKIFCLSLQGERVPTRDILSQYANLTQPFLRTALTTDGEDYVWAIEDLPITRTTSGSFRWVNCYDISTRSRVTGLSVNFPSSLLLTGIHYDQDTDRLFASVWNGTTNAIHVYRKTNQNTMTLVTSAFGSLTNTTLGHGYKAQMGNSDRFWYSEFGGRDYRALNITNGDIVQSDDFRLPNIPSDNHLAGLLLSAVRDAFYDDGIIYAVMQTTARLTDGTEEVSGWQLRTWHISDTLPAS